MASAKLVQLPVYRVYQFFTALKAYLPAWAGGMDREETRLIETVLPTPAQQHLFRRMSPNDRRHALAVARTLQQAGYSRPALLQAALLHDVAKSLGQPILHRVLIVLLEAFAPGWLIRLSRLETGQPLEQIGGWRRPFVIHAHHPALGAAWAGAAGCEPLAVRLIARHQEGLPGDPGSEEDQLLVVLKWADDLN